MSRVWHASQRGKRLEVSGASMEITMVNNSPPLGARLGKMISYVALPILFGPWVLAFVTGEVCARDQGLALQEVREPVPANSLEAISRWINDRFSASEIKELSADDFRVESHACSCADKPDPHFPYLVVLFTTPKGDLVARPEGQENMAKFTPLAVRTGDQYCRVESEQHCYGSFASVCEFTDFRYGPFLQPFFPTCK
jgi:hypothetical protein